MRRLLVPSGLVALAVVLGLVLFAGPATTSPTPATSSTLTASTSSDGTSAQLAGGAQLFAENCSTCHGSHAQGSALAPNLRGLGSATVDLWVGTGLMPLSVPTAQPIRKPDKFDPQQTLDIAYYVASLTPGQGIPIPAVSLTGANLATGFDLFTLNCAPCHTVTGAGDALADGVIALPLDGLTATDVMEAIETGPGNMPRFNPGALTSAEANDVVAYVTKDIEHPANPGGLGLGGVGPVAEGFIGLFIGVGACMLIAMWIGDRTEEDAEESGHGGHAGHEGTAHV